MEGLQEAPNLLIKGCCGVFSHASPGTHTARMESFEKIVDRLNEWDRCGLLLTLLVKPLALLKLFDDTGPSVALMQGKLRAERSEILTPGHRADALIDQSEKATRRQQRTEARESARPISPMNARTSGNQGIGRSKWNVFNAPLNPAQTGMISLGKKLALRDHRGRNINCIYPFDSLNQQPRQVAITSAYVENGLWLILEKREQDRKDFLRVRRTRAIGLHYIWIFKCFCIGSIEWFWSGLHPFLPFIKCFTFQHVEYTQGKFAMSRLILS